jgi:hypothetical protein
MVQVLHEASEIDKKFSLVFFATLGNRPFVETCFNGKLKWRVCFKTSFLKNGASTNDNDKSFLIISNTRFS